MKWLYRIFYRSYRMVSWGKHVMARRFTAAGMLVLTGLAAAAMTGLDTENTVAYQALTPLLFCLLPALLWAWTFRAKFEATRQLPRFGTVGEPLNYRVRVKNLTRRPQNDLTLVEEFVDPRPPFK